MEFRKLGRTNLEVSIIGLGTEYLNKQSRETVVATVQEAIEQGVNYLDIVFSFPEYLDNLGAALQGERERVFLAGHLGSTEKNGQYCKTRSPKKSELFFLDLLKRVRTEYVDILMLHNCDQQKAYDEIFKPKGLHDLAQRLKQEGKARFIGFSGHTIATGLQAVESGHIDVLMIPLHLATNAVPGKKDLLQACVANKVGVVAMKPYAGGKLLRKERTVRIAGYQMGGESLKVRKSSPITASQCLSYTLSQVGVSTVVPGCASPKQLTETLAYLTATEEEKDYSGILADFQQYVSGECVYCNHCLPCPSSIDIGQVNRLLDIAQQELTIALQEAYTALMAKASDCTQCGVCTTRCPFGVDVIAKMKQAVTLYGS